MALKLTVPTPETGVCISALLVALFFYRAAWTPPQAKASDNVRVETKVGRVIPTFNREAALVARTLVTIHLLTESYVLYLASHPKKDGPAAYHAARALLSQFSAICPPTPLGATTAAQTGGLLPIYSAIGITLIVLGGLIRTAAHRTLGEMYTWEKSLLKTHKLTTTGPYRFVRHPGYTGLALVCVGYTTLFFTPGTVSRECLYGADLKFTSIPTLRTILAIIYPAFITIHGFDSVVYLIRRSYEEDALMRKEFGKDWEEWAGKVRWRVFPFVL